MNKKILTIILGAALVGAFFLPYASFAGMDASGYDIVSSPSDNWQKYLYLIIPVTGLLLLIGALNNGNYILGRGLLCVLPLLAILYIFIVNPIIEGGAIGDVFEAIVKGAGIGLWITIASALVLAVYHPKS